MIINLITMDKTLNQLVKPYLVYRDEEKKHNFSSQLKEQTGLFCIPGEKIEDFWNLYCEQLEILILLQVCVKDLEIICQS